MVRLIIFLKKSSSIYNQHKRMFKSSVLAIFLGIAKAQGSEQFLKHPMVGANANTIKLETYGHDYFGPLYVGKDYTSQKVIFDTMEPNTYVIMKGVDNAAVFSDYDPDASNAQAQYVYDKKTMQQEPEIVDIQYGPYTTFQGTKYSDDMCLYQTTNNRTPQSGRMCARSMNFYAVNQIFGSFDASGVVGLAPRQSEDSLIYKLFKQDQITNYTIGMNFERPNDVNSISELHLGYYDFGEVRHGEDGVNYYENIG